MANITVKVDDLTGEIIREDDFLAEVTAEINGRELRWDLGRASYALFMERMEPFLRCAQVIRGAPAVDIPVVEQPALFDPSLALVAAPEPEIEREKVPGKPKHYPKVRASKKLLFSAQNLERLEASKGRSILLLRGASTGNFSRQSRRAMQLGIVLSRKNIRTARSYTLPSGVTAHYRVCDIYGRKL